MFFLFPFPSCVCARWRPVPFSAFPLRVLLNAAALGPVRVWLCHGDG
jgi:hypothetical protein